MKCNGLQVISHKIWWISVKSVIKSVVKSIIKSTVKFIMKSAVKFLMKSTNENCNKICSEIHKNLQMNSTVKSIMESTVKSSNQICNEIHKMKSPNEIRNERLLGEKGNLSGFIL